MAERKFDYNNVGNVYNQMKNINDNIKNLLNRTDTEVHNKVDVCDEAIYGDLGNQLLLSWDNISSNFPNFMDNFENWSALIAKASGDYSKFEADVAGFKNANPLGVTSAGATKGAVATSSYNNSYTAEEIERLDVATRFYEPTGATYVDTGMVEYAKKHKVMNVIEDSLNVASIVLAGFQISSVVKAASPAVTSTATKLLEAPKAVLSLPAAGGTSATQAVTGLVDDVGLTVVKNSVDDVVVAGTKTVAGLGDDVMGAAARNSVDDIAGAAIKGSGDDIAGAAIKGSGDDVVAGAAKTFHVDPASGQKIVEVTSKTGNVYTSPQQIYDDVAKGVLPKKEGVRMAKDMFEGAGNVMDDVAGSTPAQKWIADIANAGKSGFGNNIASTASASGTTGAASTTSTTAAQAATKTSTSAAQTAAANTTGSTTGARTVFKQKVTNSYTKVKDAFGAFRQNPKATTSKVVDGIKNTGNTFVGNVKAGGAKIVDGAKTAGANAKTNIVNGIEQLNRYSVNPSYAGKYAVPATGVNIVNIGSDATFDNIRETNNDQIQANVNNQN